MESRLQSGGRRAVEILRRAYADRLQEVAREKEQEAEARAQEEAGQVVERLSVGVQSLGCSVAVAYLSNRAREILVGEGLDVEHVEAEADGDGGDEDDEYYLVSFDPTEVSK